MIHHRHPETILIAAANTIGRGADAQYVGRNQLDAATLDRFILAMIRVDYDPALECHIMDGAPNGELCLGWIHGLRDSIDRAKLRRLASTRLVIAAAADLRAGQTLAQIQADYFADWSADEKRKVGAE